MLITAEFTYTESAAAFLIISKFSCMYGYDIDIMRGPTMMSLSQFATDGFMIVVQVWFLYLYLYLMTKYLLQH